MSRTTIAWLVMAVFLLVSGGAPANAEDPPPSLLEEARRHARSSWSWTDRKQTLTLTIIDGRGNERTREVRMFTRRGEDGSEKSLAVFLAPADVRGTAFLQHTPPSGTSVQWLHLPELGRTRKITSSARRKSFMGTDFSYADLDLIENVLRWDAPAEPAAAGEEAATDREWFQLDLRGDDRGYDRVDVELERGSAWMRGVRMYAERGGAPSKRLTFEGVRLVGSVPTAQRLRMQQPAAGSETLVVVSGVEYDSGVDDGLFTKRVLERGLDHVD